MRKSLTPYSQEKVSIESHLQEAYGIDEGGFFISLCPNSMTLVFCLPGLVQNLSTRCVQMRTATGRVTPATERGRGAAFNSTLSHLTSRRFPQLPCALMTIQKPPWMKRQVSQLLSAAVRVGLRIRWGFGVQRRSGESL